MYRFSDSGNGIAYDWTKTGGTTSFANGIQTLSTTGASTVYIYRDIYMPFDKEVEVTFSVNITSLTGSVGLSIQELDSNGNESGTPLGQSTTSTGIVSRTFDTFPSTPAYRFRVFAGQDESISFNSPTVNIGTSTEYISR